MSLWYVNEFHIQLLAIELLLCTRLRRRKGFLIRLLPLSALFLTLPALVPQGFGSPIFRIGSWFSASFLIMLALSGLVMWASFEISFKQLVFLCCVASTIQHMVHCLSRVFWFLAGMSELAAQITELVIMLIALVLLWWFLTRKRMYGVESAELSRNELVIFAAVSSLTVYFFSTWSYWNEGDNAGEQFFDFMSCLLLLVILLDLFRFRRAEQEQLLLTRLLRQEQEQHEMSRAAIEVINRKCHDLKHQISALRTMPREDREKSITELESAILLYDNMAKTGNDDLDIVLAEKTMLAEKNGVHIQCMVDGARLGFMSAEDICSLFGNALDNAIEAASLAPPEDRFVTLETVTRGTLLNIHAENPSPAEPRLLDGLPVTTKGDESYHGFGMRSMRYVAEKYGGILTTGWKDGIFSLDILFMKS